MNCPNCNHPVREGAAFCVKCGYRLSGKPQIKTCPVCGRQQNSDSFFCIECGHSFEQEPAPSQEPAPGPIPVRRPSDNDRTVSYQDPAAYQDSGNNQEPSAYREPEPYHGPGIYGDSDDYGSSGGYGGSGSYGGPGDYEDPGDYGKKSILPVILAALAVLLLAGAGVLAYFTFVKKPNPPVENTETPATEKADDTEYADDTEDENTGDIYDEDDTEADWPAETAETLDLPGVGSSVKNYPKEPSDFLEYSDSNGMYSFVYPRDFFQTCTYSSADNKYEFITADGRQTYRLYDEPAAVANNPGASARRKLEEAKSQFDLSSPQMYTFTSKEISDTGYFRTIITGPDRYEEMLGHYYIFSCTSDRTYILSYDYYYEKGDAEEYSLNGYLTDCLYRGWSISGSSYRLRNYDLFKKDDMGTKK